MQVLTDQNFENVNFLFKKILVVKSSEKILFFRLEQAVDYESGSWDEKKEIWV
jgi:hypothetical protein